LFFLLFGFRFLPTLATIIRGPPTWRDIQKHVLPNGLGVITETMSPWRSFSVGVWVGNGFPPLNPEENCLAHCHGAHGLQGQGSPLPAAIASRNGCRRRMLDAFTSKEQSVFKAKILDSTCTSR